MKSLTNSENSSSNPLQEACSSFQEAKLFQKTPVILKIVSKASFDMCAGENRSMTAKETPNRNFVAAFEILYIQNIGNVFKKARRTFVITFLFYKAV